MARRHRSSSNNCWAYQAQMKAYTELVQLTKETNPLRVRQIIQFYGQRYGQKFHNGSLCRFWQRHNHHAIALQLAERSNQRFTTEAQVWLRAIHILFGTKETPSTLMKGASDKAKHGWLVTQFNELFAIRFGKRPALVTVDDRMGPHGIGSFAMQRVSIDVLRATYKHIIDEAFQVETATEQAGTRHAVAHY